MFWSSNVDAVAGRFLGTMVEGHQRSTYARNSITNTFYPISYSLTLLFRKKQYFSYSTKFSLNRYILFKTYFLLS